MMMGLSSMYATWNHSINTPRIAGHPIFISYNQSRGVTVAPFS